MNQLYGFTTALDEEELLEGWYTNTAAFCDKIYCMVDKKSTDRTVDIANEIKKRENGRFIVLEQETFGDSDRYNMGEKGLLNFMVNANLFIKKHLPKDAWFMWLACDERLNPNDRFMIYHYMAQAENRKYNAVAFEIHDMYPDEKNEINYNILPNLILTQTRVYKNTPQLKWGMSAHNQDIEGAFLPLRTSLPLYHFGHVIKRAKNCWWRNDNGLNLTEALSQEDQVIPCITPFKDWKKAII